MVEQPAPQPAAGEFPSPPRPVIVNWAVALLLLGSVCFFLVGVYVLPTPSAPSDPPPSYVPTNVVIAFGILSGLLLGGRNTRVALWILSALIVLFYGALIAGAIHAWPMMPSEYRTEALVLSTITGVAFAMIFSGLLLVSLSSEVKPFLAWSRWQRVQRKAMRRTRHRGR